MSNVTEQKFGSRLKKITDRKFVPRVKKITTQKAKPNNENAMRAITYSMDLLIPGLYIWFFGFTIRIGGSVPDDSPYKYPGEIHSRAGIGLVLPGYKIFTTYQGSYDPRETSNTRNSTI